jgi:hypothetical protein
MGNEEGVRTKDSSAARFFDVNYTSNGEELGRVNLKITNNALTVIFDESMNDNQAESVRKEWFAFLKELRQFARSNMLTFDTRDIAKSNLNKRDYEHLAQESGELKMSESKLFGTSKTSYQDIGEAKIIVKHSAPVNYNNPAGRTQRIESIYIESSSGEKFRYPARHLNGARAMAVHVANGGTPYDGIGLHIAGLSEELSKLRQFKNYTQRSGVMAEALGDITQRVLDRIDAVKYEVSQLQKQTHYEAFRESFAPSESQEIPEDMVNSWVDALTIRTFNEELKSVFPYIYKLVSEKREGELNYEDLVAEATEVCEVCNEDICSCDANEVNEADMFGEFEQSIDSISTLEYEQEAPTEDEQPTGSEITQEVMEFIASMYDKDSGTFPRGEEGVKIAVEKKFGEQASQFANYVVEKLSVKSQGMGEAMRNTDDPYDDMVEDYLDYLESIGMLDKSREEEKAEIIASLEAGHLHSSEIEYALSGTKWDPLAAEDTQSTEGSDELLRIRQLSGM